jgi:hypothetical protein
MNVAFQMLFTLALVLIAAGVILFLFFYPTFLHLVKKCSEWQARDRRLIELMRQKEEAEQFDEALLKEAEEELKQNVL